MRTTPIPVLPTSLPDYAPGRIVEVAPEAWPDVFAAGFERHGIRTALPRFGLCLHTLRTEVDPARVRAAMSPTTTAPLRERRVAVTHHAGVLWVVGGHTALAAHLASGSERIPVDLVRPLELLVAADDAGVAAEAVVTEPPADPTIVGSSEAEPAA